MKKLFVILFVLLIILPTVAMAEGAIPSDPFTWAQLATIAGATAAVLLIVQLLKLPLDKVWKIPTRAVVYAISLVILLLATIFTEGITLQTGLLTALNAVIVALAAMGAYEMTFRKLDDKKLQPPDEG